MVGQRANVLKTQCNRCCRSAKAPQTAALDARIASETIDVTLPPVYTPAGHRHPPSTTDSIVDIFCGLGYQVVEGPDIESDYYNFSALNIPEEHPARDMQTPSTCRGSPAAHPHLTGADSPSRVESTAGRVIAPAAFTGVMPLMPPTPRCSTRWRSWPLMRA